MSDLSTDADRLTAFKRNERTRAGAGAKAAKVALENAHRRDMEAATMFRVAVTKAYAELDRGLISTDEALADIRIALGRVTP